MTATSRTRLAAVMSTEEQNLAYSISYKPIYTKKGDSIKGSPFCFALTEIDEDFLKKRLNFYYI